MAISNFHKTDEYGFVRPDDFDYTAYDQFFSQYLNILVTRARKWNRMLKENISIKKGNTLKRYVRKGVPGTYIKAHNYISYDSSIRGSLRGHIWMAVSGMNDKKNDSFELYQNLLEGNLEQDIVNLINTDMPRTFPSNIFFNQMINRQHQLFNILVAYAHHNKEVGYCQGLNYIAGLLLLATNCEITSFWLLKYLVEEALPPYYTRTMQGLVVDIKVLTQLVHEKYPDIYEHISKIGLPWPVIFTKWFVCLFAEVLPTETVLRIWDSLFYEGSKILFRVGLTLIFTHRSQILKSSDFMELRDCFCKMTTDFKALNCHTFMQDVFRVPGTISNAKIDKLRTLFKNGEI